MNLTGFTETAVRGRNESYGYTAANRLNASPGPWGSLAYTYDGVGNRLTEALTSGLTTTWTYAYPSTSNKLSTVTEGSSVRTLPTTARAMSPPMTVSGPPTIIATTTAAGRPADHRLDRHRR
ncbi:MAG TPA: hypothetical protein VHA55_01195 [Pseudorhodoplanes sp.]|nr:hypothetical protein [Pseudorhodoplanes sp.]